MGWGRRSGAGGTQNPGPAHTLPLSAELRPAVPPLPAPSTAPVASCDALLGAVSAPAGAAAPGALAAPVGAWPPRACAFCFCGRAPLRAASQRPASRSLALLSAEPPSGAARAAAHAARAFVRGGCFCPACSPAAASPAPRAAHSPASAPRTPLALAGSPPASAALHAAPGGALPGSPGDVQPQTSAGALALCGRRRALRLPGAERSISRVCWSSFDTCQRAQATTLEQELASAGRTAPARPRLLQDGLCMQGTSLCARSAGTESAHRDKRGLHLRGMALFFAAAASPLCALAVSASCGCAPAGSDISSAKSLLMMPWCREAALKQAPIPGEAASGGLYRPTLRASFGTCLSTNGNHLVTERGPILLQTGTPGAPTSKARR